MLFLYCTEGTEIKNRKNTQHKTDIVIKKNGKAQTECVKSRKMPFQNPVKAKYDERKQNNTVQPHQMEKICHIVSHQCVGNRKNQARRSDTGTEMTDQKVECQTTETDLDKNQKFNCLWEPFGSEKKQNDVQRTHQVIGI